MGSRLVFSTALLLGAAASPLAADDWPSIGGNAAGQRRAPEPGISEFLAPEWRFDLPAPNAGILSSPVTAEGYVYVGARDGKVRCFRVDPENPKLPVWEYQTGDIVEAAPLVDGGRCYVSSRDGVVYAFDAETGTVLWRSAVGGGNVAAPVAAGGIIFVGTGFPANTLVALDAATGAFRWLFSADGQPLFAAPAVGGSVVYAATNGGRLYAIDAATGAGVAAFNQADTPGFVSTTGAVLMAAPLATADAVYLVPGGFDNHLYGWNAADGAPRWGAMPDLDLFLLKGRREAFKPAVRQQWVWDRQAQLRGQPRMLKADPPTERFRKPGPGPLPRGTVGPFAVECRASALAIQPGLLNGVDVVYAAWGAQAGAPSFSLCAVRTDTGAEVWRYALGDAGDAPFVPAPVAAGGLVFAAKPIDRKLVVLGAADKAARGEWALNGDVLSSPAVGNGRLFVATMAGSLVALAGDPSAAVPSNRPPAPPAGFTPAGFVNVAGTRQPVLTWLPAADPDGDPVSYLVRADDDGEVLRSWKFEAFIDNSGGGSPTTSVQTSAAFADDSRITWRVRARDSKAAGASSGAWSPWSAPQVFFLNRSKDKPLPASDLLALPGDARVDLRWKASPSNDVKTYRLWVALAGQPFTTHLDVGNVTAHAVGAAQDGTALVDGTAYAFKLSPVDFDDQEGTAITAQATPVAAVRLNGTAQADLAAAVAAAQPGDVIQLASGTITLGQTLGLREGVGLAGAAPGFTVIDGGGLGTVIRVTDQGSAAAGTISNLTIRNGGTGIDTAGADVIVRNVVFRQLVRGLDVQGASQAQAVSDTFTGIATGAVVVDAAAGSAVLRNDLFIRNTGFAVTNLGGTITGGYNDFYFNGGTADGADDTVGYPGFGTDLAVDVAFVDEANGDCRELPGSLAVDTGDPADTYDQEPAPNGQRINLGAWGNTPWAAPSGPLAAAPPPGPAPPPPSPPVTDPPPASGGGIPGASGGTNGSGGPCAVTTAAYATTASAHLTRFYRLRDETLRTNLLGSDLVKLYYRVSPPVADTVRDSEVLRMAVRRLLGTGE